MRFLDALCCDGCREKIKAIEARDANTASNYFTSDPPLTGEQCMRDRRELLVMIERLLGQVAASRENQLTVRALFDRVVAHGLLPPDADLPPREE